MSTLRLGTEDVAGIVIFLVIVLAWLGICAAVGAWNSRKGGSFIGAFLLAVFFSPVIVGIVVALRSPVTERVEERKLAHGRLQKCPACAEPVRAEAKVCRYCGEKLGTGGA